MLVEENSKVTPEPENFQEVFQRYYPVACRQAAYLLGCTEAAEDVAQEVFVKLYYSPPREFSGLGGWLARVTANLSFNYLKQQKNRRQREQKAVGEGFGNVFSLEDRILKNNDVRLVRDILAELNERDRICLLLKFSGYSYREIAEITGVETGSVGTILARAQARFKTLFVQKEGSDAGVL